MHLVAATSGPGLLSVILVVGVAVSIGVVFRERHRRQLRDSLQRFIARHEGWHLQAWPCGFRPEFLVGRFAATPRGDRRYGVEHAVGGPLELDVDGHPTTCQVSCFQWFHERRRRSRNNRGVTTTSYERRRELVVLCQLPLHTHRSVSIGPESVLGRIGLTRGGAQLESESFNRRFRVEGRDRELVVRLLDAELQELLLASYTGRTIEFSDDLVALSGAPDHHDGSLTGVVRNYPAVVQDLTRLVRGVPHSFWRAMHPSDGELAAPFERESAPQDPSDGPPRTGPDGPEPHSPWGS